MDNPTIVVLTDRLDLDNQLFDTFVNSYDILRQTPKQAESRADLQNLLKVQSGGIVFTTIQKFWPDNELNKYPELSDRDNIVVIADEAHRTQYGFAAKMNEKDSGFEMRYGFAKYVRDAIPNASFIAFTGTPVELDDRSTKKVFGDYIHTYDMKQAVDDKATVPIAYSGNTVPLALKPAEKMNLNRKFGEITESEATDIKNGLINEWTSMEKVIGTTQRLDTIADHIINHFEERCTTMSGKGMIVCFSRRICVEMYERITKRRPEWHHPDDDKGSLKIIMTGSASDGPHWQQHIRNKERRRKITEDFKNPDGGIKLIIVVDMLLTGFDAPILHTMYIDKPLKGHTLIQAIARVNRIYHKKPGGLVVDYFGIFGEIQQAVTAYTQSGEHGIPISEQNLVTDKLLEKYEIVKSMFHGSDYKKFFSLDPKIVFL